ncbi:MAG: ComEC/Rec2 family competence protein [Oligosphaeraceae bacterium]|nr:ComEC/Rec2 family competence protein [Oligosphaeraceae bacterium]
MRQAIREIHSTAPAFWWFLCQAAGVVAAVCPVRMTWLLLAVALLGISAAAGCSRPQLLQTILLFTAGHCWGWLFDWSPWQTYRWQLPREECAGVVRLRIVKAPVRHPALTALGQEQESWQAEILALRTHQGQEWCQVRGKVILRSSRACRELLRRLRLGDCLQASGDFLLPPPAGGPGGYYRSYLKTAGIRHLFLLREIQSVQPPAGASWDSFWQDCRERLGAALISGLQDQDNARMLLVLGLGLTDFLPRDLRTEFVRSGTVHIFAISGLHVGMAVIICQAVLLSFGCRLRRRWLLLQPLLLLYFLLTGGNPSVMRAVGMVMFWHYANWRYRPPSPLHCLGLIGFLALWLNPLYILHTGFIYSYLIVVTLILGWPAIAAIQAVLNEKYHWIPRKYWRRRFLPLLGSKVLIAFLGSSLAWLGSAGISLRLNGQICFLSPVVNMPLWFIVFAVLALSPPKIILGLLWPAGNDCLARLLDFLMPGMQMLAATGANAKLTCTGVPFTNLETILYHLALAVFLLVALGQKHLRPTADQPTTAEDTP